MNKKANTALFILGATLFNILVTIFSFMLLLLIFMPHLPESAQAWAVVVIFIAAIAMSFVVYRLAMKILLKKIPVDKYFAPLCSGRRKPQK
jgi:hypothetical protein